MARNRSVAHDPELVELFSDDPGGLAVVDAIRATQRPRGAATARRRALSLAIAVALITVAIGAFTRNGSQAGVIEKALQALRYDRVMTLVIETSQPGTETVNLRTGRSRPLVHTVSEWFDPRSKLHRVRDAVGGVPLSDTRSKVAGRTPNAAFTEIALTKFARTYRTMLGSATGRAVSRGTFDGANVYWIRFPHNRSFEAVAISATTFKPVQIVARQNGRSRPLRVVSAQSLAAGMSIPAAERVARPARTAPISRTLVSPQAAADFGLTSAALLSPKRRLTPVSAQVIHFPGDAVGGEFVYGRAGSHGGALPPHFIRVQESTKPEPYFGWSRVTVNLSRARDEAVIEHNGGVWVAYVTGHGRYFRIMTSDGRAAAVATARALAR
jgi:hypothetical protein